MRRTIGRPWRSRPACTSSSMVGADAFLITEDRLTLIDAGLAGSRPIFSVPWSRSAGPSTSWTGSCAPTATRTTLAGCGSWPMADRHVGGGPHPSSRPRGSGPHGAGGWPAHAPRWQSPWPPAPGHDPPPGDATPLNDGDVLPVLGGLQVIHTPGHTPAACASLARARGSCSRATCSRFDVAALPSPVRFSAMTMPRLGLRSGDWPTSRWI